jgi:hypothetical protein
MNPSILNVLKLVPVLCAAAQKLSLSVVCGVLLTSVVMGQDPPASERLPDQQQQPAPVQDQQMRERLEQQAKEAAVLPANDLLNVVPSATTQANQVVDGDIIFTSPGQFTYARDIKLSDNFGGLRFIGADSLTTTPAGAAIQFFGNNASPFNGQLFLDSGAHNQGALIFRTAPTGGTITERMRVGATGNVTIGSTNTISGGRLRVETDASGPFNAVVGITTNTGGAGVYGSSNSTGEGVYGSSTGGGFGVYGRSSTTAPAIYGYNLSGGYAGYFVGNVYTTGFLTQNSDARLKRDVTKLSYGLREVLLLHPVSWEWKAKSDGTVNLGLIAQEVEPLIPELVSTGIDAEHTKGLNYIGLIPVLVKGMQEQQTQIEQQENRLLNIIKEQQAQIERLKQVVCLAHPDAEVCKLSNK